MEQFANAGLSANARRSKTYQMTMTAVMTAVTCVLAPLSIPIGPVPISLTNLVIYFSLYLLGWKLGTLSYIVYVLIGMCGAPVFSGFTGGLGKLLGPTGGYIIGFIPMAILGGWCVQRFRKAPIHFLGLALGTVICYVFGTAWFCYVAHMAPLPALSLAVFPFLPFDAAKILLAVLTAPRLRSRALPAGHVRD